MMPMASSAALQAQFLHCVAGDHRGQHLIADPQTFLREQAVDPHFFDEPAQAVAFAERNDEHSGAARPRPRRARRLPIGSASRNPVRGPAYRDVDLAVTRRVGIGGSRTVELRVEAFNVLDTPAFGAPAAVLGAANFGTITSAGDPRVVQLAVKVDF
jgi:hypothetical protein